MARPSSATSRVMVCMLATRALPPRRPKDTNPSPHGQISRVIPTLAPERLPRFLVRGKRPTCPIEAIITASWAETSTTWGRPEASALKVATTASGPTWDHAVGSVHRTGARSGSPVQYMFPVDAITPRSVARQPRPGAVGAERGDVHPHRARRPGRVEVEGAGPTRRVEHHVGVREEPDQSGVVGAGHLDTGLARVPGREAQRRAVGPEGRHAAQGVAAGGLDLDHLGAEIGEDPSRHRGGLAGQVDDAHAGQQRLGPGPVTGGPRAPRGWSPRRTLGGGALEDVHAAGRPQADDMGQADPGALDLAVARLTPQVRGHLVEVGDAGGADGVALGDEAARHVDGDGPVAPRAAPVDEVARASRLAQLQVLVVDELGGGEAVVQLHEVEVLGRHPGLLVGGRRRPAW